MTAVKFERRRKSLAEIGFEAGAPGEVHYCYSCRSTKPKSERARYCEECAITSKEYDDTRRMPDPFYSGSPKSFTLGHLLGDQGYQKRCAPLGEGERELKWLILPPFQRPPVWTARQQSRFIESLWLELPVGSYIYNRPHNFDHPTSNWLLDGQQRIGALFAYEAGEIDAFGWKWHEIGESDRRSFENMSFPAFEVVTTSVAKLREIYDRLAYGGTPHEPKP